MVEPKKIGWIKTSRAWFDKYFQMLPWPNTNPSFITVTSIIPAIFAAIMYPNWSWVFFWILITLFFDLADGAIAKKHKRESRFGYLMDLSFDRITEFVIFIPIMFTNALNLWVILFILNVVLSITSVKTNKHTIIPLRQAFAIYAFMQMIMP